MSINKLNNSLNIPFLQIAKSKKFPLALPASSKIKSNNIKIRYQILKIIFTMLNDLYALHRFELFAWRYTTVILYLLALDFSAYNEHYNPKLLFEEGTVKSILS
jgi:hypothetical protein